MDKQNQPTKVPASPLAELLSAIGKEISRLDGDLDVMYDRLNTVMCGPLPPAPIGATDSEPSRQYGSSNAINELQSMLSTLEGTRRGVINILARLEV